MGTKKYKRLTLEERIIIETLLKEKKSKSYIAKQLKRDRSTVTREVNLWVKNPEDKYNASLAHWNAMELNKSKHFRSKIERNKKLRIYVFRGLLNKWSPELISGRIKKDYPNDPEMRISYESIYRFIYEKPQGNLNKKLIKLLVRHKSRRRKSNVRNKKLGRIVDAVSIEERPDLVQERERIGDFEGDLIIGKGQKSAIATQVDRKSRYTLISKLNDRKSKTVVLAMANDINRLPKEFRKTMTYDNGSEMAQHKLYSKMTNMQVYFAHPYSSWERGTNENTNGLIRRFLPKGTDFNNVSIQELKDIEYWLNNRPMKILGYRTPQEVLDSELPQQGN